MYFYVKKTEFYILNIFPYFVAKKYFLFVLYLAINSIFILKYSVRFEDIPVFVSVITYLAFFLFFYFIYQKAINFITNFKRIKFLLVVFSLIFFVFLVFINLKVDGLSLNTDRWSALEVLIKSVLNGKYPYDVLDHLGNTTSNLPGLFYIGLPFYLLGDVGFLQPFTFLLLSLFIIFSEIKNDKKVVVLFLILFSPAYYWEVIGKSDLMSNCILLLLFISYWQQKFQGKVFKRYYLLAFFVSLFVLTRGIVVIPLTLFLFSKYLKISIKSKIYFAFCFLFFLFLFSLPILINFPDFEFVKEHNPFNHQTAFASKFLTILSLILPFIFSSKVKKTSDIFLYSIYILGGLVFITFILNIIEEGFYNSIYGNLFDISYLSMILPFIFFYLLEKFKENSVNIKQTVK